jgi:hypothetical protein
VDPHSPSLDFRSRSPSVTPVFLHSGFSAIHHVHHWDANAKTSTSTGFGPPVRAQAIHPWTCVGRIFACWPLGGPTNDAASSVFHHKSTTRSQTTLPSPSRSDTRAATAHFGTPPSVTAP